MSSTVVYDLCKRVIEKQQYFSKEDMSEKLEAFLKGRRISLKQKEELVDLLKK